MKPELSQGEVLGKVLELLRELAPGLQPTKIDPEKALLPQLDLPQDEFQKLQGMIYDAYGAHLPAEKFSPSSTLMEITQAIVSGG
ncbi:MAG: hypothetical protein R3257_05585 [bacterium]|nr:hypothetical protein [bacterium]